MILNLLTAASFLLIFLCILTGCISRSGPSIFDDFENPSFSSEWRIEASHTYAITVVDDPVESDKALRFEWRRIDWDGTKNGRRAELRTDPVITSFERWACAKIYFSPDLLPPDPNHVVLMQFHGYADKHLGETGQEPVAAVNYRDGEIYLSLRAISDRITTVINDVPVYHLKLSLPLGAPLQSAWNSFVMHLSLSPTKPEGVAEIWLNGNHHRIEGIFLGYNDRIPPYFKFGLYLPRGSATLKKVAIFDDVALSARRDVCARHYPEARKYSFSMKIRVQKIVRDPFKRPLNTIRIVSTKMSY